MQNEAEFDERSTKRIFAQNPYWVRGQEFHLFPFASRLKRSHSTHSYASCWLNITEAPHTLSFAFSNSTQKAN